MTNRRVYVWFLGVMAAVCCRMGAAQTPTPAPTAPETASDASSDPGLPSVPVGEVKIEARQFGVGAAIRAGELFGVQLVLTDSADKPRKVVVSMGLPDDDGDTALVTRSLTLNPRIPMEVWLYGRAPPQSRIPPAFEVSIHDASDAGEDLAQAVAGRQIAAGRVRPITVIESTDAMIGVVGRRDLGLDQYELRDSGGGTMQIAHELSHVISGLEPATLPDDWRGLAMFDTIVWSDGDPLRLEGNRPQALREWINRGGHLVVVLPSVGGTWWDDGNPLIDVMPVVEVRRLEDANLSAYRHLLATPDAEAKLFARRTIVQTMTPRPEATPAEAVSVIDGPEGTVVSRRLVGTGMVTVIGLNLGDDVLNRAQLLKVEAFWHRVLGGRFAKPEKDPNDPTGTVILGGGTPQYSDDQIGAAISKSASAAVGVLLALIVFGVYWLVAGPLGWGVLRAKNATRHAWVAFALTTALFTAIAWAGATAIKPKNVRAYHLTILDHVYGQPIQRMRTWAGVLLPGYGQTTIRAGERDADTTWRHSVTTWSAPPGDAGSQSFPDARSYVMDTQRPESVTLPMRATMKEMQIDFAGGPRWKGLRPTAEGQEPRLVRRGSAVELAGSLVHDYPAPLKSATVIVVTQQMDELDWQEAREKKNLTPLLAGAFAQTVAAAWAPGTEFSIAMKLNDDTDFSKQLLRLVPTSNVTTSILQDGPDPAQAVNDYMRLSLMNVLAPPGTEKASTFGSYRMLVRRRATHGYDMSRWFTQPCVIVIGVVDDAAAPTPMFIMDGDSDRPISSEGRTVVRWVYPLASDPVLFTGKTIEKIEKPKDAKKGDAERPQNDARPLKPTGGP